MWEDDENKRGGKFILRVQKKKRMASKHWEDLVLAFVGQQFDVGDDVCGVVVSVRYQEDIISVWNKNSDDGESRRKLHDAIKRILGLSESVLLEYKAHDQSIKDNSSFRNTEGVGVPTSTTTVVVPGTTATGTTTTTTGTDTDTNTTTTTPTNNNSNTNSSTIVETTPVVTSDSTTTTTTPTTTTNPTTTTTTNPTTTTTTNPTTDATTTTTTTTTESNIN